MPNYNLKELLKKKITYILATFCIVAFAVEISICLDFADDQWIVIVRLFLYFD